MTFCALPDLGPVPVNIVFSLNSGPAGGKPAVYGIGDGGHFLGMRIDLLNIVPVFPLQVVWELTWTLDVGFIFSTELV